MSPAAVAMHGIRRRFGPVLANDDVSFELAPGEIHALVGENGAGKTTLMRILCGLLAPDAGRIELDGRPVRLRRPLDAMRAGIGMVHQHFLLVDTLTVAENVTLGHEAAGWTGALDRAAAERSVDALGRRFGLPVDAHERVGALPVGLQQRVEILKVLARGARVLVLDEPTAVLTPQEVEELFGVLRALRDGGTSVVLITHKLGEVIGLAERVTILRGGRVVGGGRVANLSIGQVAELMVGRTIPELQPRAAIATGAVAIAALNLGVRDDRGLDAVRAISFEVRAGEIVGLAGVEGNGQHELVECLAGIRPAAAGEVRIGGRRPARATPRAHAEAGLAHIPSDRLRRGLVPQMTLAENLALGRHLDPALGRGVWLSKQSLARHARGLLEEYDVRPAEPSLRAAQLSGGNQQKLIAARELSKRAPAVIAAHPTRGVDLGAVDFLHRRLLAERDRGAAVLLVSSELSEILALADRILVMHAGRLTLETRPADTDERALGLAMAGRPGSAA